VRANPRLPTVGSPRAIGLLTFLISIPIGVVATFTASKNPFESLDVFAMWSLIALLSHAALGGVLILGNLVNRSIAVTSFRSRCTVITATIMAAATRGVVISLLTTAWAVDTTASGVVRVLSSAVIFSAWLTIIGAVLAASDRYRAEVSMLLDEAVTRALTARRLDPLLSAVHSADAGTRVADGAGSLAAALTDRGNSVDYAHTSEIITAAIDEWLRPLSHEMWFAKPPILRQPDVMRSFVAKVWRTPIPYRRALPLMVTFLIINSSVWHGGIFGLAQGAAAGIAVVLIVMPLTAWGDSFRAIANATMYGALLVIPMAASAVVVHLIFSGPLFDPAILTLAVGIPVGFWLGAAAQTAVGDRAETIAELRARILEPDWNAYVAQLHRQAAESSAATFLHNTVQSRLTAAALQLQSAAADNDVSRAEAAVALALSAVALATQPARGTALDDSLVRISAVALAWAGIADVIFDIDGFRVIDAKNHKDHFPDQPRTVAWTLVADAVEECVANAIRHGKASTVRVSCRDLDEFIETIVADDGHWESKAGQLFGKSAKPATRVGIGLAWLDRVSGGDWSATENAEGTTLRFSVRV
jgi:hypothetical protein